MRAVKRHEQRKKKFVSESSVSSSELCECNFVTSRRLVGGGRKEWDFFEKWEHVVMLRFLESTPCMVDIFLNNVEEIKMGW